MILTLEIPYIIGTSGNFVPARLCQFVQNDARTCVIIDTPLTQGSFRNVL